MTSSDQPFEECLLGHQAWLRTVVRSRIGQADAVDDIVSDILAAAVQQHRDGKSIKQLAPWLYRVAVLKVLQHRRADGRRRQRIKSYSQAKATQPTSLALRSPLELTLCKERRELIAAAMDRLPGKYAEILRLKYVHDWKYDHISEHLGISRSRVTHRLRVAREKLRVNLNQLGVGTEDE